ncbi:MAG: RNA 2',3'-cyclic phosphodiesterase [Solirubrobacterales bacterium]
MAKERLKSPRARLFIALDLPAQMRAAIVEWGRDALSDPALRRVDAESLHITLAFLGYLPEREIERLAAIVTSVKASAPQVELRDPVPRPARGRPRLYALPAESSGAVDLQAALREELVAARLYKPEKRSFWPHVTVARVRSAGMGSRQAMRVVEPPQSLPEELGEHAFGAVRLTLYRSEFQPRGARYTQLAQIELPKGQ